MMMNTSSTPNNAFAAFILAAVTFAVVAIAIMMPRSLAFILLVPGFLLLGRDLLTGNKPQVNLWLIGKVALGITALLAINTGFSLYPQMSAERAIKVLALLLLGGLSYHGYKRSYHRVFISNSRYVLAALAVCCAVLVFDLVLGLPLLKAIGYDEGEPHAHAYNRSLVTVSLLIVPFLCFFWSCRKQNPFTRIGVWICLLLVCAAVISGVSQAAQLALLLAVIIVLTMPVNHAVFWRGLQIFVAALIVFSPFIFTFLHDFLMAREDILRTPIMMQGAAGSRLEIWNGVAAHIFDHPFTGHGIGVTRELSFESDNKFWRYDSVLHPHNFALQLWLEFGVLGALLGSALFAGIIGKIRNIGNKRIQKAALVNLFGWMAIAGTGYGLWQSWWVGLTLTLIIFWLYIIQSVEETGEADV